MCTRGPECQLRSFGAAGCVVPTDCDRKCGQTDTLEIAKEFHRCYEMKMKIIEQECSPDQLQDKLKLQREWIEDLKEQNDMLIACIQELEYEATHRVLCLEEKLKESAKCICEVMKKYREHDVASDLLSEPLQKIFDLENDQQSLLMLINRGRFRNDWNTDDLRFLTIKRKDIFDETYKEDNSSHSASSLMKMTEQLWQKENALNNEHMLFEQARGNVLELEQKIITCSARDNTDYVFEDLKRARNDYEILKRQTEDMRHALTEEVASKHDMILALKKDCQQLEERCLQADKQTAFKDDIIKELRKEIKQLKQQINPEEINVLHNTIDEIRSNLKKAMDIQEEKDKAYQQDVEKLNEVIENLKEQLRSECKNDRKSLKRVSFQDMRANSVCVGVDQMEHEKSKCDCNVQTDVSLNYLQNLDVIKNKEEIIKIQNDTFNLMRNELQTLKQKEQELCDEKSNKQKECIGLQKRIKELETCLRDAEERAKNLQLAVDLYTNSINVLEATEEKYKLEIDQQKITITNLQEALISSKHELDELKHKTEETVSLGWAARWFGGSESKQQNKSVHDV